MTASYISHKEHRRDDRLSLRIPAEMAERIEVLARHCGRGRSEFVRTSVALAEATMMVAALSNVPQPNDQQRKECQAARRRLAEVKSHLLPTAISPPVTG